MEGKMKKIIFGIALAFLVFVPFLSAQLIVVDGQKDAFYETLTGPDDGYLQLRAFTGNDNGYPDGDADLSCKMWFAWDDDYLYFYEEVKDDIISMSSANTYNNDGFEIKVDPQATDSVANSIVALGMTALDSTGGVTGALDLPNSFRKTTADGYVLEAAIPWDTLKTTIESVDVGVGNVFGCAVQNHDNDNASGARDASIQWAAFLTDRVWNTPKYCGTVEFLADNKLKFIPTNNMTGVTNTLPYDGTVPTGIVVDGIADPFYHLLSGPDDGYIQIKSYAFDAIGIPHGDADLSAKIWGAWDPTWLYLYAEIMDDTISVVNTANFFRNDCLELKVDGLINGSKVGGPPTAGGLSSTNTITALDTPDATGLVSNLENLSAANKQIVRAKMTGGYILEMALRLDSLGGPEHINAMVDSVFGLGIDIVDNDGKLATSNRQAAIVWGAVCSDNIWNTPNYLGTVKFKADNKISFSSTNGMTAETNPVPYDGTPFYMQIDGKKDPFYWTLRRGTDGYVQVQHCHWSVGAGGEPSSNADMSAKLWSAWDDTWFYLYAEITDDTVSSANITNFFQNDCLELKVDGQPTDSTQSGGPPNGISRSTTLTAIDSSKATTGQKTSNLDGLDETAKKYARGTMTGGYTLEMAIKLDSLGGSEPITAAIGEKFGLGINLVDNDGTLPTSNREGAIVWAAVCNDKIWNTPKYLGTVEFLVNNKLNFIPKNNMTGYGHGISYDGKACPASDVDEAISMAPLKFDLAQNYPNPFNPTTRIAYEIPSVSKVRLVVFDVLGREVATLVDEVKKPGAYETTFDGKKYSSGVYFFRLEAGSRTQIKKMMILK